MTRHYLDGNAIAADAHYAREADLIGIHEGEACNRWSEADEDAPTAWQCKGVMIETDGGLIACDTCGQMESGD